MASKSSVCNMALSHIGVGNPIADLDTDQSQEAEVLRVFYDVAWKKTLRDFSWPFSRKFVALPLVAQNPTSEWGFSYRYPSDCLFLRRILSGCRNDTRQSRVEYAIASDDQGKLILTDVESAQAEYTWAFENEDIWDVDFQMALSYKLGQLSAPRLSKGDPFKLGQFCAQMYAGEIARAQANAFNEEQAGEDAQAEYIRARY